MIEIHPCTVTDIEQADTLQQLLANYGRESCIPELGEASANFDMYRAMEGTGLLHVIGAFGPELVGFAVLIVYGLPHYGGRMVCSMESFFVAPEARRSGAGLKLLRAAESRARELGASALMISSPVGGRLAKVLPRSGYRETNRIFLRGLA